MQSIFDQVCETHAQRTSSHWPVRCQGSFLSQPCSSPPTISCLTGKSQRDRRTYLTLSLSATQIPPHKHSMGNGCLPLVFGFLSENLTGVFASISSRGSAWSSGPGETLMPCRCSLLSDPDVQLSSLGRFLLNPKP